MIKFTNLTYLAFVLVLLHCVAGAYKETYSREYQLTIDDLSVFDNRDDGIAYYYNAWADAAGIDITELTGVYQSVREEITIDVSNCHPSGAVGQRDYVSGDWEGLSTTQVKSNAALSEQEALDEPFAPGDSIADDTITYIEYDIHPCEADWSSTSRVFLWSGLPEFSTCADVHNYFPDAVSQSSSSVSTSSGGYTFTAFRNGTYLNAQVTLDVTLTYHNLNDAVNNNNLLGGEFSFTMYPALSDTEFSKQQTQKGIDIYQALLDGVGSSDYPCDPPVDINDFFPSSSYASSTSNGNSSGSSGSSDATIALPSFLLVTALLAVLLTL